MGKPRPHRCHAYKNPKLTYFSRAVAEYDRRILEVRCPEFKFQVFRCNRCRHWHIGRATDIEKGEAAS